MIYFKLENGALGQTGLNVTTSKKAVLETEVENATMLFYRATETVLKKSDVSVNLAFRKCEKN